MALIDPLWAKKMKIFNFELKEKLYQHSDVEFDGESDGDGPAAQKPYLDPLNGPYWPLIVMGQKT